MESQLFLGVGLTELGSPNAFARVAPMTDDRSMLAGITARQLNRATLDRQMLLQRESVDVVEAVRRIVALQAQAAASPYLSLWNRVANFDPADLDKAFAGRAVVKATLMRITLHAVHADDYPKFHNAMLSMLRAARLTDSRTISTARSVVNADLLLPPVARFTSVPRTDAEVQDLLEDLLGERNRRAWRAVRTFAPLHHVPTGGPWSFGTPRSFIAAPTRPGPAAQDESVQWLVLRYLQAFGPATARDCAQFTFLRRPTVLAALRALADHIEELPGPDGTTLFAVPGAPLPAEDTFAPPRLLPMWDSILLAYSDRNRVVPPDYRPVIFRRNGDVLPTLLVDGYVAGVWRAVAGGIEATAFQRLDEAAWKALSGEASALLAFLSKREPTVYRRYAHWWSKQLPSVEVRVLPG